MLWSHPCPVQGYQGDTEGVLFYQAAVVVSSTNAIADWLCFFYEMEACVFPCVASWFYFIYMIPEKLWKKLILPDNWRSKWSHASTSGGFSLCICYILFLFFLLFKLDYTLLKVLAKFEALLNKTLKVPESASLFASPLIRTDSYHIQI